MRKKQRFIFISISFIFQVIYSETIWPSGRKLFSKLEFHIFAWLDWMKGKAHIKTTKIEMKALKYEWNYGKSYIRQ